ncbi:MAG: ATP-binding protein, partial [Fulvivirga sp.]|uniref:ATP-binding protein n=1 Tax=Fulvivirga sp. TaxID=1931237 RepID=UPI0032EBD534
SKKFKKFSNIDGLDFKRAFTLLKIKNELFISVGNKIYSYSEQDSSFIFAYTFHEGIIKSIEEINDNHIVFGENNRNEKFIYEVNFKTNSYSIESYKFNNFPFRELEDIDYDGNRYVYFTTTEHIYKFDTKNTNYLNTKFSTLIRNVNSLDSTLSRGYYTVYASSDTIPRISTNQTKEARPSLTYDYNSIRFDYAATFLELPEKTKYSFTLDGYDKSWSDWTKETTKEYTNLSPGQYTFKVKSLNVFKEEGTTATYTFTILPPWYMTTWAYALFTLGGVLGIWFIVLAYSYRVRLQRRKLKLIVADRTFEVLSQKKEIEKQNDKLKEQFEEIQKQRDDINEKNQELEMSQEEILSINERLQELNSSLEKKVDERTSEIRVTVKKLQSTIAELDTFIYRASHDLKGPISRINGLTSLAKLEASNPNDIKYYNLIELVAKDMNKLLAKLTQVHEVINCEVEKNVIDLPVMISDVRNSIKFLDPEDSAKYSFNLETTLQVKSDPFLMAIVLTNLMENALIFRNVGKPCEISISAFQNDSEYCIIFQDNGAGIPPEHIDKVFNMFHRGSDQSKGSGLGLYLSQMAIEKLGGSIKVESEYNAYTKFTITIPK